MSFFLASRKTGSVTLKLSPEDVLTLVSLEFDAGVTSPVDTGTVDSHDTFHPSQEMIEELSMRCLQMRTHHFDNPIIGPNLELLSAILSAFSETSHIFTPEDATQIYDRVQQKISFIEAKTQQERAGNTDSVTSIYRIFRSVDPGSPACHSADGDDKPSNGNV